MSRWWQRHVGAVDPLVGAPVLVSTSDPHPDAVETTTTTPPAPTPTPAPVPVIPPPVAPAPALVPTPAGVWWCSQFPGSDRIAALASPFRECVDAFVKDLRGRGCTVEITATLRPPERAWLMYWVWMIVRERFRLDDIPVHPGIPIVWTLSGAIDMFLCYGLVHKPAEPPDPEKPGSGSRHLYGLAVDMHVGNWMVADEELVKLGASFGVHKLAGDAVHWSIDGH
jgi:hypothetical protein